MLRHLNRRVSKRDHLSAFNSVQFTMYYTFFFNVDAVVCQNNDQFQVWELNIWQFIVIVEIKYFLNLNEYDLPIFILSIHFRQISFSKITKDIQSNNNNNIVLSMLYAEICPKVRRHNSRTERNIVLSSAHQHSNDSNNSTMRVHSTTTLYIFCI